MVIGHRSVVAGLDPDAFSWATGIVSRAGDPGRLGESLVAEAVASRLPRGQAEAIVDEMRGLRAKRGPIVYARMRLPRVMQG